MYTTITPSTGNGLELAVDIRVPSLYADNRAIFSVELTAKGTRFILGSFDGFIPAGVVYELNYVAMQRAYNVKVEGLPSDIVRGAGMGDLANRFKGIHVAYYLVFQRATK